MMIIKKEGVEVDDIRRKKEERQIVMVVMMIIINDFNIEIENRYRER